jgi:hypothetical protein
LEAVQSLCAEHPWQLWSTPQIGLVPVHADAMSGVHCTHVCVCMSHTPVGAAHGLLSMQTIGSVQLLSGFLPLQ